MKDFLRKYYLNYRLNANLEILEKQTLDISNNLFNFITNNFKNDKIIAGYYPIKNEVNLINIYQKLIKNNYKLALPSISEKSNILEFYEITDFRKLSIGKYNIKESSSNIKLIPDIIIIPLIACDKLGNRIGYGAGYYDYSLSKLRKFSKVITIAPCFDFQIIDHIPCFEHDQKIEIIVTDKNIFQI